MWFTFVTHPVQISTTDLLLHELFRDFPQLLLGNANQPASHPVPCYLFLNELIIIGSSEQLCILITYFPKKCRKILNFSFMPLIAIWPPVPEYVTQTFNAIRIVRSHLLTVRIHSNRNKLVTHYLPYEVAFKYLHFLTTYLFTLNKSTFLNSSLGTKEHHQLTKHRCANLHAGLPINRLRSIRTVRDTAFFIPFNTHMHTALGILRS